MSRRWELGCDVAGRTPAEAYQAALAAVTTEGCLNTARGENTFELVAARIVVDEPWHIPMDVPERNLKAVIGAAEALQLVAGLSAPSWLSDRVAAMAPYQDAGVFEGAYGPRVAAGVRRAVELLKRDPGTRQAVLTVFDWRQDLGSGSSDTPCTLSLQYLVRYGRLTAVTTMRSNDAWLGLPYDMTQFVALASAVADVLQVPLGPYVHQAASLHLYEQHMESAVRVASQPLPEQRRDPYQRMWSGATLGDIRRTCQQIVDRTTCRSEVSQLSPFETWLRQAVAL